MMQKTYHLNKKAKRKLIAKGHTYRKEWEDSKKKRWIFIDLFAWLPVIVSVIGCFFMDWLIAVAYGGCVAFFTWIVAILYYKILSQNTTIFCAYNGTESLIMNDDELIYHVNYCYDCKDIEETRIRFDRITQMTRNRKQQKLTIEGYHYISVDSNDVDAGQVDWFEKQKTRTCEIPMYYDDMDELMQILEEKSGKKIIDVVEIKNPEPRSKGRVGDYYETYIEVPVEQLA
jgi:hypothetical protein